MSVALALSGTAGHGPGHGVSRVPVLLCLVTLSLSDHMYECAHSPRQLGQSILTSLSVTAVLRKRVLKHGAIEASDVTS